MESENVNDNLEEGLKPFSLPSKKKRGILRITKNAINSNYCLQSSFTVVYYMLVTFLILSCLHISQQYHFQLKYFILVISFIWIVAELIAFPRRSDNYKYELLLWLFWINLVCVLNVNWFLNPQLPWQGEYKVCLKTTINETHLYLLPQTLPKESISSGISNYSVSHLLESEMRDEVKSILESLNTVVGYVPVCGYRENTGMIHQNLYFNVWLHRLSLMIMIGISYKSCIEYYRHRGSRYLLLYILAYCVIFLLFPKPQPPSANYSIITGVCSSLFFLLSCISCNTICMKNMLTRDESQSLSKNLDDNAKNTKYYINNRMRLSRIVQCMWILFVWEWWLLIPAFLIQVYFYYCINKKYKVRKRVRLYSDSFVEIPKEKEKSSETKENIRIRSIKKPEEKKSIVNEEKEEEEGSEMESDSQQNSKQNVAKVITFRDYKNNME